MNDLTRSYKLGENIGYRMALYDISVYVLSTNCNREELIKTIDNILSTKKEEYKEI